MTAKVTFTVVRGADSGATHLFDSRTTCIVGWHVDCQMRVAEDRSHATVSRFHCWLDINLPGVQVRDYGSLNGMYLNDRQIKQRPAGMSAEDGRKLMFREIPLQDGDRSIVGGKYRLASSDRAVVEPKPTVPMPKRSPFNPDFLSSPS